MFRAKKDMWQQDLRQLEQEMWKFNPRCDSGYLRCRARQHCVVISSLKPEWRLVLSELHNLAHALNRQEVEDAQEEAEKAGSTVEAQRMLKEKLRHINFKYDLIRLAVLRGVSDAADACGMVL